MTTKLKTPIGEVFEIAAKKKLKVHPFAARFPMLDPDTLAGMTQSIQQDGQQYPAVVDQHDVLIEGRMRRHVCDELGIPLKAVRKQFATELERERFILASNKDRRMFNLDQSAALIVDRFLEEYEVASKAAQVAGAAKGGAAKGKVQATPPEAKGQTVRERFRADFGVTDHRAKLAIKLFHDGNDLLKDVVAGRLTLNQAVKALAKRNTPPKQKKEKKGGGGNGPKTGTKITSSLGPDDIDTVEGWCDDLGGMIKEMFTDADARAEAFGIMQGWAMDELQELAPADEGANGEEAAE